MTKRQSTKKQSSGSIKANQSTGAPTIVERISEKDATELFLKTLPKVREGSNDANVRQSFSHITHILLNGYATFDINDALTLSKYKTLPVDDIKELFVAWCKKMGALGLITEQAGCYNFPIMINNYYRN
jgi:hypothetical protein